MESQVKKVNRKVRLGPKEEKVLIYLYEHGKTWILDLFAEFASVHKYRRYFGGRLARLQKRGLIVITSEYYPETKRERKYVSLTQLGRQIVENQLLDQS